MGRPTRRDAIDHESPDALAVGTAVAANLRELRAGSGMSLDRLSEASGVSKAMLNQIETGKSTPTITVLWKIAAGLNVPFARLMQLPKRQDSVLIRHERSKILFNADQSFASRALFPFDQDHGSSEFYELTIKPGGREDAEPHNRGTRENLVVVKGKARITVDGIVHDLAPRDALVFQADVPHVYANASERDDAILYLVMTYERRG